MKILLVHNQYKSKGGEDLVFDQEVELLKSYNNDVETFIVNNDDISNFRKKVKTALTVHYSKNSKNNLSIFIDHFCPDIVHIHNFFPKLTPSIYDTCNDHRVPIIQTLHNYRLVCANGLFLRNGKPCQKCVESNNQLWAIVNRCYQNSFFGSSFVAHMISYHKRKKTWQTKVSKFIALSQFSKHQYVKAGFSDKSIIVKPNFVKPNEVSANYQLRRGALFVGRLSHEKGILELAKVWRYMSDNLTIVGDGPLKNEIKKLSIPNIKIMGQCTREKVFELMAQSLFLVVPSKCFENFPLTIVEAYSVGLPVLASNLGALAEIVINGETGLLFDIDDNKDLINTTAWALKNKTKIMKMGENAKKKYFELYTPESNYLKLIELYETTLYEFVHDRL